LAQYGHARFLPRRFSRLTLELTEVRVERLQEISEEDPDAEGLIQSVEYDYWYWSYEENGGQFCSPIFAYEALWESLHGKASWDSNPWVWALTFHVHRQNIDHFLKQQEAA
jgi:hypothetical protein